MSGPSGVYVYASAYIPDWDYLNHAVHARVLRKYARRSLGMVDGPQSAALARFRSGGSENLWHPVKPLKRNEQYEGSRACEKGVQCNRSHRISAEEVRTFCIDKLGMEDFTPKVVEVEKIVEIEVEVPMALSFEERDILTSALHREQHIANELLRVAYAEDNIHDVRIMGGRVAGVLDLMTRFGIDPDAWANGPAWLVDTNFARIVTPEQPGEVLDPQDGLFDLAGEPNAV